jgi:NAD-dependent DNA ligase
VEYREDTKSNDLFFVCSLIDRIARKTKNTRKDTVNTLGISNIGKLYDLADVYHCENIDKVTEEFIEASELPNGNFDNINACKYSVPTYWDIGKVYKRLILNVAQEEKKDVIDTLFEVYNSWITEYIDDYNSNMYYSNPGYIFESYKEGALIKE